MYRKYIDVACLWIKKLGEYPPKRGKIVIKNYMMLADNNNLHQTP
jgi:hypothetical protein